MPLRLYNTLSRSIEEFTPLQGDGGAVTFYTCGPTVYDYAHIGNFRSFLNADILRRTLELIGHDVVHVMNITDVGHMTDDAIADGGGEDKMEVAAKRLQEAKKSGKLPVGVDIDPGDPYAISNFYADAFLEHGSMLGLKVALEADDHPERLPRPTNYIPQMIELVERLVNDSHAYAASDGVVYFDVSSFPDYGRLSGNTIDALREGEGGRIQESHQAVKRSPADFMLWKPDPSHLMRWGSPWGEGYPGWHLECSVMAETLLGIDGEIDIHSGGEDNIFPHHECEIAQSRCGTGASAFARYWFHTRHLVVEGSKMSKSAGNFYTVVDILAKGASPGALRLELVRTHYRQNANFTMQGLRDCQRQIDRWCRMARRLEEASPRSCDDAGPIERALGPFTESLCDDLNVQRAISVLNEAVGEHPADGAPDGDPVRELEALRRMDSVLGVLDRAEIEGEASDDGLAERMDVLIQARDDARAKKDFDAADRIREEISALGVAIKDGPEGTTWSKIVK
jgi:cysteinyl-tRNA synthetase